MTKFGVCLPVFAGGSAFTNEIDFHSLEKYALRAEELGYASLWAPDHLVLGHEGGEYEVWTVLSALAAKTSRIRLGTLVLSNSHRNPALLAKMAGTLDYLSGGRLDLGLGAGWYAGEHEQYGLPWVDRAGERIDRMADGIRLIKALSAGGETTYHGDFYEVVDAVTMPVRVRGPRILIGGGGEKRTLRVVAEYADAWNIPAVAPVEYARKLDVLKNHCQSVGRDFAEIEKTMETRVLITGERSDVDRLVDWYTYWQTTAESEVTLPDRDQLLEQLKSMYVIGSVEECAAGIKEYVAAGVEHFTIYFLDYPREDSLRQFAELVAPRFS